MTMSDIQLLPLTSDDIPSVHNISVAAFRKDQHTLFKAWEKRGDVRNIDDELSTPALPSFIEADARGRGKSLKAVVNGEIKGWVSWGFYNLSGELERTPSDPAPLPLDAPISHPDFPDDPSLPPIDQMGNLTSAHLFTIVERLNTPPNRVVYCRSICVDPSAQGQGVGSKLVQIAVDIADEHGASMWVHLSDEPGKGAMFKKHGFVEVNKLNVDLDKYKTKEVPKEVGDKWGLYTFRILRRPAKGEKV